MDEIINVKHHAHSFDELSGMVLKDKEIVAIIWPDESLQTVTIKVIVRKCENHSSSEAYFVSNYKGRDAWSRLLGLKAKRI